MCRSWLLFHTFCSFAFVKLPVKKRKTKERKGKKENNKKELPTRSFSVTKLAGGEERRATTTIMLTCVCHRGCEEANRLEGHAPHSTPIHSTLPNGWLCEWAALSMGSFWRRGPCYAIVEKFQIAVSFYRWLSFSYRYRHCRFRAEALSCFLYLQSRLYASWAA